MMDIQKRGRDVRRYVRDLEEWMIQTLAEFGIEGERRDGRVGIWVNRGRHGGMPGTEDKIAAIGVRLRRWVSFHGVSINIAPDLNHYDGIVPCGIAQHGITSLRDLGVSASMAEVDAALKSSFETVFGRQTITHPVD
jgi:lipoyl(octanoyl) transferase